MKILLLGKNGQVGWELQRALAPLGEVIACGREQADMEKPESIRKLVRDSSPQVIINAAAYTAVDKAELESDRARLVNAESVSVLASEAKKLDAWLVHYSTDYVFDGTKSGLYNEDDEPNPLSVYGVTKLHGEEAIRASGCKHLIFRTSWVFAARGTNFARTILRLAKERSELKVVNDQFGAPTSAELIADVTACCLYRLMHDSSIVHLAGGTYHLAADGEVTWYGYAQYLILEVLKRGMNLSVSVEKVSSVCSADYPMIAKRPVNSRLDTRKLRNDFGLYMPDWQFCVTRFIAEYMNQEY